jgi:CHASE2 domain-containing sensor protein
VENRLVLVASHFDAEEMLPKWPRGSVWGSDLHAYAIETLLSKRALGVLSPAAHLGSMAVLAAFAALLRMYFRRSPKRRRLAVGALLLANLSCVFVAAVYLDLLIDGAYQFLAIVLAYAWSRHTRPSWAAPLAAEGPA